MLQRLVADVAMTTPMWCLLGFAAWTLLLLAGVLGWRAVDVLRGVKRSNEFPSGVPHGTDLYWRLNRAHLNCTENLPVLGAVVLVGTFAGLGRAENFALAAQIYLAARVAQTTFHLSSNAAMVVNLRFTAQCTQVGMLAWMMVQIARSAA